MAVAIILPVIKSIFEKLACDLVTETIFDEITGALSTKKDLKAIAHKLTAICAVFDDAEEKQYTNKAIKLWLQELKSVAYDIDDLLDVVATDALQRNANEGSLLEQLRYYISSSNPLVSRFQWGHKIRKLCEKLENIEADKNAFNLTENPVEMSPINRNTDHYAYVNSSYVIGRDEAKQDIIDKFATFDAFLNVLPIIGMGGLGKTTLAKLVYKDTYQFEIKLWVCVSSKFDIQQILEDVVSDATQSNINKLNLGQLVNKVREILSGKKYLLVLDDVWVSDIVMWLELKSMLTVGERGSVILATTRSGNVASVIQTTEPYVLDRLSGSSCWSLFTRLAFREDEEQRYQNLCRIGKSIVRKCQGNPLLVESLGSLLREVRDEQQWVKVTNMDIMTKFLAKGDHEVLQILKLGYHKLPSHLKSCFAYCSLFPKGSSFFSKNLTYYWSALGLLQPQDEKEVIEECGYTFFKDLMSRSMIQKPRAFFDGTIRVCEIHDFYHDVASEVLGDEFVMVTLNELKVSKSTRHIVWGYERSPGLSNKNFPLA